MSRMIERRLVEIVIANLRHMPEGEGSLRRPRKDVGEFNRYSLTACIHSSVRRRRIGQPVGQRKHTRASTAVDKK
jgi:hypothetical protein